MLRHLRAVSLALACLAAAGAAPAHGASKAAPVKATVLKPLTLISVQDLDLGTITLASGIWPATTVGISRTGVFSCPGGNVTCTGAPRVASYNLTGSNSQPVRITAPNVTLTNQSDSSKTLTLVVDAPATVTLPNSGNKGTTFSIGGSISVGPATATGIYVGTFAVTADYQ